MASKIRKKIIRTYKTDLHGQSVTVSVYEAFTETDAERREEELAKEEVALRVRKDRKISPTRSSKDIFEVLFDETALREFINDTTEEEES